MSHCRRAYTVVSEVLARIWLFSTKSQVHFMIHKKYALKIYCTKEDTVFIIPLIAKGIIVCYRKGKIPEVSMPLGVAHAKCLRMFCAKIKIV